jgi:hypothetical protein
LAPVLLLFLSMLRMCQSSSFRCRLQTVAVLVPSMVLSCGRRSSLLPFAVLLGCHCRMLSQLWRLLSLCSCAVAIFVDVSVFKLLLAAANCHYRRAVDVFVARPSLCRSRPFAVLLSCRCRMLSQLWRLLSLRSCALAIFVDVEDVSVFKLSLSFANCRCTCAVNGVFVRPSLSFD